MIRLISILVFLIISFQIFSQQVPQSHIIYNSKGKAVSFKKMMKDLADADVILFGELHNNPIAHWLEFEIMNWLHESNEGRSLGAEMFEADNEDELRDYLTGKIDEKGLDSLARLWSNYKTDYRQLIEFSKENNIPFTATNIPRRYARMVSKGGFESLDTLSSAEKKWIAPLPVPYDPELPGYKKMLDMFHGHGGGENFPKAQAIKDATMAHFILKNKKEGSTFLHFNGAYHSNNYEGIMWYLNKYSDEELSIKTISTLVSNNPSELEEENENLADFIIVVDENVTTSY